MDSVHILPQTLDLSQVADAVCELLKRSNLLAEEAVPVDEDYPRHRWYRNWGVDVRFGEAEGKKGGFMLFRFLTPDGMIVETFELDGHEMAKPTWRPYLDRKLGELRGAILSHRKERQQRQLIDIPQLILPESISKAIH